MSLSCKGWVSGWSMVCTISLLPVQRLMTARMSDKPLNSALHPSGLAKSSTSLNWRGQGGNVTSAGWQVTLCDPIRHVNSRAVSEACLWIAIFHLLYLHASAATTVFSLCMYRCSNFVSLLHALLYTASHRVTQHSLPSICDAAMPPMSNWWRVTLCQQTAELDVTSRRDVSVTVLYVADLRSSRILDQHLL